MGCARIAFIAAFLASAIAVLPQSAGAGEGWLHYGGDAGGMRNSGASAISAENVSELR